MQKLKEFLDGRPAGTKAALARAMKRAPSYLSRQLAGIRAFNHDDAIAVERFTEGQVRCEDVLPEVDWAVLRSSASAQAA